MPEVQRFSYHNHTNFSDGKNTPEEMVKRAKEIGFTEMGISDHLIVHKNICKSPSWAAMITNNGADIYQTDFKAITEKYQRHCEHIRKIAKAENIKLYVGFEVDFFTYDGWLEEFKDFLSQLDYDYIISGNHFLFNELCDTIYNINKGIADILDVKQIQELIRQHFKNIQKSVESDLFRFVAHLDYVRKMGQDFCKPQDFWSEKMAVLNALEQHHTGLEVSTKGLRKIGDFYPNGLILDEAAKRKIKVVISDDAHKTTELGYDFAAAEHELEQRKMTGRLQF